MNDSMFVPLANFFVEPPRTEFIVQDLIPANSTCLVFGESGAGKSLVIQDLAFCVSQNMSYAGKNTKQGDVIYLCGEGFDGMGKRLVALAMKYELDATALSNNFFVSKLPVDLMDANCLIEILNEIEKLNSKPALIIIDTLHRNMMGDENSASDIARMLNNVDSLRSKTESSVIFVHHSGHGDKRRVRGSSSIHAAMDVEYTVKRKDDLVELECSKNKDIPKPSKLSFSFEEIVIGDGLTAPVLSYVMDESSQAIHPHDYHIVNVLSALSETIGSSQIDAKLLKQNAINGISVQSSADPAEAKRKAYKRAFDRLIREGRIRAVNDRTVQLVS